MTLTAERKETRLDKDTLLEIMEGIHEKVEKNQIQNDQQMMKEVMQGLEPIYQDHHINTRRLA
ncbi:hypothetical protein MUN89_18915 [Halobacillus salinarum]|uniref:Uncharacterized protein n=1 Tax=Halobacillus salinarum TaxID=2932257 RepID=A0ABY4EHH7_9BACI|nr:hypothetical protein [Halobacillus salinarum]UOQ43915.1 hypothetical protein MUN89_18915 [Halobacillus salinarum]